MGIFQNILHQRFVHRTPGPVDDFGGLDTFDLDQKLLHGVLSQVQPIHLHLPGAGVQRFDGQPVFGGLAGLVFVFDAQPFPFVDGFENRAADAGHGRHLLSATQLFLSL